MTLSQVLMMFLKRTCNLDLDRKLRKLESKNVWDKIKNRIPPIVLNTSNVLGYVMCKYIEAQRALIYAETKRKQEINELGIIIAMRAIFNSIGLLKSRQ